MSKSSEEATQWMNDNIDDELGLLHYNEAMNGLFIAEHETEEKDNDIKR